MKTIGQKQGAPTRLGLVVHGVAAVALAIFVAPYFLSLNVIWNPGSYGDLGLNADETSWVVEGINPGSVAEEAGIKIGDRFDRPRTLHDRLLVSGVGAPRPDERIMLTIASGGKAKTIRLQARPVAPMPTIANVLLGLQTIVFFVFLLIGLILVLVRPSKMTWGFYLVSVWLPIMLLSDDYLSYVLSPRWYFGRYAIVNVLASACAVGFLIFCLRFPNDQPTGWRRTVDKAAPYLLIVLSALALPLPGYVFPTPSGIHDISTIWLEIVLGIILLGATTLLVTFFQSRSLERYKMKWVVLGLACTFVALLPIGLLMLGWLPQPNNPPGGVVPYISPLNLLFIVLPMTVGYAVLRHRVIDIRFVVSRSVVFSVIALTIGLIVVGVDWLFSTRLPNSRFEVATYAGIALIAGFLLNAARQSIGRAVDFMFFRQWHRTQEQAEAISGAVRQADSKDALLQPLTDGIARAFSLGSAALFERLQGAGFVRVAARGWPDDALWHILSDHPLAIRTGENSRVVDVDALELQEPNLPAGVARPTVMVPIVAGRHVLAMLLCGAHENGTSLDRDEIRAIRRLCADAGAVYSNSSKLDFAQTAFVVAPVSIQ